MSRVSVLEPYKDEIIEWLAMGYSYQKIIDELYYKYELDVSNTALFFYCRHRKLTTARAVELATMPLCDYCDNCDIVIMAQSDNTMRLCQKSLRLVNNATTTSPQWCPLREKNKNG